MVRDILNISFKKEVGASKSVSNSDTKIRGGSGRRNDQTTDGESKKQCGANSGHLVAGLAVKNTVLHVIVTSVFSSVLPQFSHA